MTAILRNTINPLKNELPAVPRIKMRLMSMTISMAGMLMIPPSQGQAVSVWGR